MLSEAPGLSPQWRHRVQLVLAQSGFPQQYPDLGQKCGGSRALLVRLAFRDVPRHVVVCARASPLAPYEVSPGLRRS